MFLVLVPNNMPKSGSKLKKNLGSATQFGTRSEICLPFPDVWELFIENFLYFYLFPLCVWEFPPAPSHIGSKSITDFTVFIRVLVTYYLWTYYQPVLPVCVGIFPGASLRWQSAWSRWLLPLRVAVSRQWPPLPRWTPTRSGSRTWRLEPRRLATDS